MGSSITYLENVSENPYRDVFVQYDSHHVEEGGIYSNYVVFKFTIRYLRYSWKVHLRYHELLALHRNLVNNNNYKNEVINIQGPAYPAGIFTNQNSEFINKRARIMTRYLQNILDKKLIFANSSKLKPLLGNSAVSFNPDFGRKGMEGWLRKCSGGYVEKFSRKMGDYVNMWRWRWVCIRDNGIGWYHSPTSTEPDGWLQLEQNMSFVSNGRVFTVITNTRRLSFQASTTRKANEWFVKIEEFYQSSPRAQPQPNNSSFPVREFCDVRVYTLPRDYFQAVAVALLSAQKEILIMSWKNSPTVILTRPPLPSIRLDQILKFKAEQGVKIYVLLYKEVEYVGNSNDSQNAASYLRSLSKNIQVIRHPNKIIGGSTAVLWSHHEKVVVVDRNLAFAGGIDLSFQRWDDEKHIIADELGTIFPGHDYRQPAPGLFRPVRPINLKIRADHLGYDDIEENGVEIYTANESELPVADAAAVDTIHEADVIVDFGVLHEANLAATSAKYLNQENILQAKDEKEDFDDKKDESDHEKCDDDNKSVHSHYSDVSNNWAEDRYVQDAPEEVQAKKEAEEFADDSRAAQRDTDVVAKSSSVSFYETVINTTQMMVSNVESFLADEKSPHLSGKRQSITMLDSIVASIEEAVHNVDSFVHEAMKAGKSLNGLKTEIRDAYPRMPWHDVAAGVCGMTARDLASHFVQRWNHHRLSSFSYKSSLLVDSVNNQYFSSCARCCTENIEERIEVCPTCGYNLGPYNSYSREEQSDLLPLPMNAYSFIMFDCYFRDKLPFRMHGDCPVLVTNKYLVNNNNDSKIIDNSEHGQDGIFLDAFGSMTEFLTGFGLTPVVGDIIYAVDQIVVTHLNLNQLKRMIAIKRNKILSTGQQYMMKVTFRRHFIEGFHLIDSNKDSSKIDEQNHTAPSIATPVSASPNPNYYVESSKLNSRGSTSNQPQKFDPICSAAAVMELKLAMSQLYYEESKRFDLLSKFSKDGTCKVQVLRSIGKWSIGTRTECSIQNCWIETIRNSKRLIYIENQFFISGLAGDDVQNSIAVSILDRILQAYAFKTPLRVIIIIPLHPNGDFANSAKSKLVMHFEYQTINRNIKSLFQQLKSRAPDIIVEDYITFHSLRNWGVIDGKVVSDQVYVHDKVLIVDDRIAIIGSANINDRSMLGNRDSEVALCIEDTQQFDVMWAGEPHLVGLFAHSFRLKLMAQHVSDQSIDFSDPFSVQFQDHWLNLSKQNSSNYDAIDGNMSYYRCKRISEFKEALANSVHKSYYDDTIQQFLQEIKGFLVDWPYSFLCEEDLSPSLATRSIVSNDLWV
eukprot:gene13202-17691_t